VRTVRADRLTALSLAEIEVDGRPTTVIISEIEPDPFAESGSNELQVTFEIFDDDPRSGQIGVTTLGADEDVRIAVPQDWYSSTETGNPFLEPFGVESWRG
jgi:hypothetical protein